MKAPKGYTAPGPYIGCKCEDWQAARRLGGCTPSIVDQVAEIDDDETPPRVPFVMGCDASWRREMPAMRFCPWCGLMVRRLEDPA